MPCTALRCPWIATCSTRNARTNLAGAEGASLQLLSGWHQDDIGRSLWSNQNATLLLLNPGPGSCLTISGLLAPASHKEENILAVECDGHCLGVVRNSSRAALDFEFRSLIPSSSRDLLHIRFRTDDMYCPAEMGEVPDRRALGFALFSISAAPLGAIDWAKAKWADGVMRSKVAKDEWLLAAIPQWIDSLGRKRAKKEPLYPASPAGLSIIVLDSGDPHALAACRKSIEDAVRKLGEPFEVLVGGDSRTFRARLKAAKYPWVYFLDSSYALNERTLPEVLRWRAPQVFAVGSAVGNAAGGWMRIRLKGGLLELEERKLEATSLARGAPCLKPGTGLYNRRLLCAMCRVDDGYESWDWRSLEWSVRSWKMGFETIFCPESRVHRAAEGRNANMGCLGPDGLRFLLRNSYPDTAGLMSLAVAARRCGISRKQAIGSYYAARFREGSYPCSGLPLEQVHDWHYIAPGRDQVKPALIFVSPYVIFPPCHGSAVGMAHLLRALEQEFTVHLISDESAAYGSDSQPCFSGLATARLLSGRVEKAAEPHNRIARIESHSHPALRETLRMVMAAYRPRFIEIEHIELAGLIDARKGADPAWVLNLHDVLLLAGASGESEEDRYELGLIGRYDSLICCSREDASMLGQANVAVVPNGVDLASIRYEPSPAPPRILFVGPWRVAQNLPGIEEFLQQVYPVLLCEFDSLELWYLGGKGSSALTRDRPCFGQRGVRVIEYVEDVQTLMQQCALTINPIRGNRGACMKVAESLAAGRVCVSTLEGARGYLDLGLPSLVTRDQVRDLAEPLRVLLGDIEYRRGLELLDEKQRYLLSWENSRDRLLAMYASLARRSRNERSAM